GGFIAPFVRRVTPRAALLGTLAGVSVTFISMRPAQQMFMTPAIGVVCFAIILASWVGGVEYKGIPAGPGPDAGGSREPGGGGGLGLGRHERRQPDEVGRELRLLAADPGVRPRVPRLPVPGRHPGHRDPVRYLRPRRGDGQRRERGGRGR